MRRTAVVLTLGTLLVSGPTPRMEAQAAIMEGALSEALARQLAGDMGRKLGRGVVNTSTGWIEFPKAMYVMSQEWGPAFGVVFGSLHGLEASAVRTLAGVYEAATFPVPIPAGYTPVVMPTSAFTWQGLAVLSPR